jgi:GT2 family glycosyltransferase
MPEPATTSTDQDAVAVVVLTWNGRDDTLACLRSLARVEAPRLRIVVVDNGSSDGTVEAVRQEFPEAEVIDNGENLGFAAGNNAGIGRALELGASHVLVLNNDVEVDPGFAAALLDEAGRRPDAASLGSKILFAEPRDLLWFAGASFDPRRGYNGRQRGYRERDDGRYEAVVETDRACGAAILVPRQVLEEVGVFDPQLFLYFEDTDWSLRARAAGRRHYVVPASKVWHKVSVASGGESSPTALYYGTRNSIAVAERHAPLGRLGTWRRRLVVLATLLLQALRSGRRAAGVAAVLEGFRDAAARRLGRRGATTMAR